MPTLRNRFSLLVALSIFGSGFPTAAVGQDGRINGNVRDAGGRALAGARVTATHTATRVTRVTTTSSDGSYALSGLAAGGYTVAANLFGYRRMSRADVTVPTTASVDFTLEVLPLQAITVTATLREQELAEIPFSIAAPTASVLRERGVDNIEMIAANVAGFSVQNLGPGQSQVAMRGASSGQIARDQPGVKEQVGAYLDDVPVSLSLFTPDLDLFDLSRVEVLRGPQGTLFGAGSLAGTVRYITNQPDLGVREVFGELGTNWIWGGNRGTTFKVGTNAPIGDRAATRIAVFHNRFGGWMDAVQPNLLIDENVNTGERSGARVAVKVVPNARLEVTPRLVMQKVRMDGWNRIDTFNILGNPYTTTRPRVTLGDRRLYTQMEEPFTDDFILGDLNLRYDFGRVNLTSITSYSYRDVLVVRDATALTASVTGGSLAMSDTVYTLDSPLSDATVARVFTQEARLAGGNDRRRWLLGAFHGKTLREYGQSLIVQGFEAATGIRAAISNRAGTDELFFSDLDYDMKQTAVFGEGTLTVGGRVDVTAGLRYYSFKEDRSQVFDGIFSDPLNSTGSVDANGVAPRVMASFKATDNVTLNAQASQGFRLGGINDPLNTSLCTAGDLATFTGLSTWEDETAWNYEVGMKSQWMGGRASLNASAFFMDIKNLQMTVTAGSCSSRLILNVPDAVSQGAEIEFSAAPNQNFDLAASATFSDSELRSQAVNAAGTALTVPGIVEGNRLPSVPRFQGSASATYRRPLRSGGTSQGFLTGSVSHVGSRYTLIDDLASGFGTVDLTSFPGDIGGPYTQNTFTFDPQLPAYTLLNTRVGVIRANWEVAFYINNVADTRAFLALDRERGTRARVGFLTNQPRTFGVTMAFNY